MRDAAQTAGTGLWWKRFERRPSEALAKVGVEDSERGTRGQLVGGMVKEQVA